MKNRSFLIWPLVFGVFLFPFTSAHSEKEYSKISAEINRSEKDQLSFNLKLPTTKTEYEKQKIQRIFT